jgi:phosphoenolpyruvate carboxylase
MATQHPDNAHAAYFLNQPYVSAADEIAECYECFSNLGVEEYMWDWEGKFVDEAVIDRLFQDYYDYFKKNQLGKDKFLTFRIPNIWEEPSHRLPRAYMNLISADHAAKRFKFNQPPLFEVILPMARRADQLCHLQDKFQKILTASEDFFDEKSSLKLLDVIPLFEEVETMAEADTILKTYADFLQKDYNYKPEYMRVFLARSDPAMNAGLLPTMLAVKSAISSYHEFGEANGIKIYPWIGGGSLPFRGAINPENIDNAIEEYKGSASMTVQSSFRYDYKLPMVKTAIQKINKLLPENLNSYRRITKKEAEQIKKFNVDAKKMYQQTVESIAPVINNIASQIPGNRERVQHVGISGYFRGMGKVKLPRAIKFTGSLYSIGIPPELIGMGRALEHARKTGMLELIEELYLGLRRDLEHAGHYFNRENLNMLIKKDDAWKDIDKDIKLIEEILDIKIGPITNKHMIHRNLSSNTFYDMETEHDITVDLLRAARIRKSLG